MLGENTNLVNMSKDKIRWCGNEQQCEFKILHWLPVDLQQPVSELMQDLKKEQIRWNIWDDLLSSGL